MSATDAASRPTSDRSSRENAMKTDIKNGLEDALNELTRCAFFMRGMWLDPGIPAHVKKALEYRWLEIEEFVQANSEDR